MWHLVVFKKFAYVFLNKLKKEISKLVKYKLKHEEVCSVIRLYNILIPCCIQPKLVSLQPHFQWWRIHCSSQGCRNKGGYIPPQYFGCIPPYNLCVHLSENWGKSVLFLMKTFFLVLTKITEQNRGRGSSPPMLKIGQNWGKIANYPPQCSTKIGTTGSSLFEWIWTLGGTLSCLGAQRFANFEQITIQMPVPSRPIEFDFFSILRW